MKWLFIILPLCLTNTFSGALELPNQADIRSAYCLKTFNILLDTHLEEVKSQDESVNQITTDIIKTTKANQKRLQNYLNNRVAFISDTSAIRDSEQQAIKDFRLRGDKQATQRGTSCFKMDFLPQY